MATEPKLREPTFKELMEEGFHVEHITSNIRDSARIIHSEDQRDWIELQVEYPEKGE
tara:strand:- start:889 stop:1059 length:171 start_codon:yes stop_codon:yes gene_type:complete